jgi:hypothetical protein
MPHRFSISHNERHWTTQGHAAAIDSTPQRPYGRVWNKKHQIAGEVPQSWIDTEAAS